MNLDKQKSMDNDLQCLPSTSSSSEPVSKSNRSRGRRTESLLAAPNMAARIIRRRRAARPPKNPKPSAKKAQGVPARRKKATVVSTIRVEDVRQPVEKTCRPLDRNSIVREPETLQARHLMSMSPPPSTALLENFISSISVDHSVWLDRFKLDGHMLLMKMKQEVQESQKKTEQLLQEVFLELSRKLKNKNVDDGNNN